MTCTPRDIEKLRAIGHEVRASNLKTPGAAFRGKVPGKGAFYRNSETEAWDGCKAYAQSPEGMKATMADKVRWLGPIEFGWWKPLTEKRWVARNAMRSAIGDSPEAAVDALFWKVQNGQ